MCDGALDHLQRTGHEHHWHNLEILHREQEEMKDKILQLQQGRDIDNAEWTRVTHQGQRAHEDFHGKLVTLAQYIEGMRCEPDPESDTPARALSLSLPWRWKT